VSCRTGDVLADEQETAGDKEGILGALDRAAGKLRGKLGESLSTVEKFDTPLEQATTPSLEALQAYTLGRRTQAGRDEFSAAVPFYQRAIRFDPNFAIAYAALGVTYWDLGEIELGAEYGRKAYELHAPISEPERFYVETAYFNYAIGDLDKTRRVYDIWTQTYPRNASPRIRLWRVYEEEGKYEDALVQIREAIRLDPSKGVSVRALVTTLIELDRLQEARATARQAVANGLDSPTVRAQLYKLAFLENDAPEMSRQAESVTGKPGGEDLMLELEAQTAAYSGHLKKSRDLSRQAVESTVRAEESETAASLEANAALREALFGNATDVHRHTGSAPEAQMGRRAQYAAALSFAIAGDSARGQLLADDLARRYPDDTLVKFNFLPTIRAQIALDRKDPSKAIDLLQSAGPYDLSYLWWGFLGPVYVRGEAYLMAHKGVEAASEFQKILDHRGIVGNSPVGALAHLQLGRGYELSGDKSKAKTEYQEFLALWKDADPDIPILRQAKAEYARLK
jgi:tetratricopeptide (TPR) repeat protein